MSYIIRPKFLSGFEVEWASSLGAQTPDDFNPDLVEYSVRDFEKRSAAARFAKGILPKAVMGDVRLTPWRLEEYAPGSGAYFKEYEGQTEYFTP